MSPRFCAYCTNFFPLNSPSLTYSYGFSRTNSLTRSTVELTLGIYVRD